MIDYSHVYLQNKVKKDFGYVEDYDFNKVKVEINFKNLTW